MALPGMPATVGASPLDQPPPSPTPMGGQPAGGPFSPQGLVPQVPSDQMPPEVLTGLMQAAQTVAATLDSFAQVTPDKGAQLALIKDLLQRYLADVMAAGAGPVSPTAPGPAFPGGGIDRGISGPGSV
jgi:hypothetical protein